MTEETHDPGGSEEQPRKDWRDEAEEALTKTGDALGAAWEATREARMAALESAKDAAKQLGEAIDRGVAAAKERWAGEETEPTAPVAEDE